MLHILSINVRKTYSTPVTAFSSLSVQGGGQVSHGGIPLLTEGLLKDLLLAGLNASGFSEKQRWELFEMSDYARRQFRISPMLQHWPFEVLGRKPHMDEDVVKVSHSHTPLVAYVLTKLLHSLVLRRDHLLQPYYHPP